MAIYLQIKSIPGNATSLGHENWIELNSFDAGVSRHIVVKPGRGTDREKGLASLTDFVITKTIDKSSPYLFQASCTGGSLGTVKLNACGGSNNLDQYLQYTLSDVIISHYDINGISDKENDLRPHETLHLNFTKIEMSYVPRSSDNKPQSPINTGYDVSTSSKI
jgi:type VI secretion system secreted protein Hcp